MTSKRKELRLKQAVSKDFSAILLKAVPTAATDTVDELNATGLTLAEIKAASQGKRFGVAYGGKFYQITSASYTSDTAYSIAFANVVYAESTGDVVYAAGSSFISVSRSNTTVTTTVVTVS